LARRCKVFVFKQEEGELQPHGVTLPLSSHPSLSRVLPGVLGERGREENRGFALPVLQRAQREGGVRWYITSTIVTTRSEGANDSCGRSLSWRQSISPTSPARRGRRRRRSTPSAQGHLQACAALASAFVLGTFADTSIQGRIFTCPNTCIFHQRRTASGRDA
jgi:hypothetical protein